ncbi:MAG: hypothetical protein QOH08_146, partial [Chloroflexota bacterium]|nr:hypothetical protein [Chloroflexota bacterium]
MMLSPEIDQRRRTILNVPIVGPS